MEQIFMLVFMVILIGIVIYFGIKENKETTKENNKIEEDPDRFNKKTAPPLINMYCFSSVIIAY